MRLFICSDERDTVQVDALADVLSGYRLTIDVERMMPNRDNRPTLQAAIQGCDAFVFALTANSRANKRCSWEVGQAIAHDCPIITVTFEASADVPPKLAEHLAVSMAEADGEEKLLDALFVAGATPPAFLVQFFRSRLVLAIVVLLGLWGALLVAGPRSPYREQVAQALRDVVAVADRTDPRPTATPSDPNAPDPFAPMQAATQTANVEALVARGQAFAADGDMNGAITRYNEALALSPNAIGAYIGRGEAHLAIGAIDAAWGDFTRAIELAPNFAVTHISRADFYVQTTNPDSALADLNAALAIEPNNARAYRLRGSAYRQQGDFSAALTALEQAITLAPNSANAYSERGEVYRLMGDASRALDDFGTALALDSGLVSARYRRGQVHMAGGRLSQALEDFNAAISAAPNHGPSREARAALFIGQGDYAGAITDFSRAIAQSPDDAQLYLQRAGAYRCTNEAALAVADTSRAATLDLDSVVNHLRANSNPVCVGSTPQPATDNDLDAANVYVAEQLVARAAEREASGDMVGAENDYTTALAITPTYTRLAAIHHERGGFYERMGRIEAAGADYAAAVDIVPESGRYHMDFGRVLVMTGEREEGLRAIDTAQSLDPLLIEAFLAEGDIYRDEGDNAAALALYTRASYIDRDYPPTLTRRATLSATMGDCDTARADVAMLEVVAPDATDTASTREAVRATCES